MLDAIKSFFYGSMAPDAAADVDAGGSGPDPRLAACALLLELAHADEEFTDDERQHLEAAVRRHFGLEPEAADKLIELADLERRKAVDLWQFTRLIADEYSLAQKMVLAETMWGLVYADGELSHHEEYLMRKLSNLLGLEPGYLSAARKRAGSLEDPEAPGID